jgi:DNA-binding transcriptional ArsR family regulator
MVTHINARRDVFQAIADPHRREILLLLARRESTLNEVAEHFTVSRPAISRHMRILAECGLVQIVQRGRERRCLVVLDKLTEVADWVEQSRAIWTERFDRLDEYLAELQKNEGKKHHGR